MHGTMNIKKKRQEKFYKTISFLNSIKFVFCSSCIVIAQSGYEVVTKCWCLNALGIVTFCFYHMITVTTRKRNKNTKQRRRKEQTLMENINKEKDVKTGNKRKEQQFYIDLPAPPEVASHAQWYFTGETRCFLRWEFPQVV